MANQPNARARWTQTRNLNFLDCSIFKTCVYTWFLCSVMANNGASWSAHHSHEKWSGKKFHRKISPSEKQSKLNFYFCCLWERATKIQKDVYARICVWQNFRWQESFQSVISAQPPERREHAYFLFKGRGCGGNRDSLFWKWEMRMTFHGSKCGFESFSANRMILYAIYHHINESFA